MGKCCIEGCETPYYLVQEHHIIHGRGKRKQCETPQSKIYLCWNHHLGTYGVHGREGHTLDIRLKIDLQKKYFAMGYTESQVKILMGDRFYYED